MKDKIYELLDEKINEVFFEMQTKLDITDGGIMPLDALYLEELQKKLADHIEKVLEFQKDL